MTNSDKYRIAANITEYHIVSKVIIIYVKMIKINRFKMYVRNFWS